MRVTGKTIWLMDMGDSYTQMVTYMRGNGKMIKHMVKEPRFIKMDRKMKDKGLRINKKEKVKNHGLMDHALRVFTRKEKKLGQVILHGLMVLVIMVSFSLTISKDMVSTFGLTKEHIQVFGFRIKCMGMGYSHGLIIENM